MATVRSARQGLHRIADQFAHPEHQRQRRPRSGNRRRACDLYLGVGRTDDFASERLKQPHQLGRWFPILHSQLQSKSARSSARRMRLRVVSYSRSDSP